MEWEVNDSIRKDLVARLLDITLTVASEANSDNWKKEDGEDQNKEDTGLSSGGVNLPRVPLWYRNAEMKKLWDNASPSQKESVEEYKNRGGKTAALEGDETGEAEDDQHKVMWLQGILWSVTNILLSVRWTHFSQHDSRHAGVECHIIQLLDQIFDEMGFVGSVCLAGPDPQKGGELMTLSCIPLVSVHSTHS